MPNRIKNARVDWKEAMAKRAVVEMYCNIAIKGPVADATPTDAGTPMPNPVTGDTTLKDDEPLRCAGVANANVQDRVNERLDPQGCVLINYLNNPVFLANHTYKCEAAIGQVDYIECKDTGVHFEAWVGAPQKAPLTPMQKDVRSLMAQGILRTVSVGFIPLEIREPLYSEAGELREPLTITKWELLEISVVPVPCNAGAIFELKEHRLKKMQEAEQSAKGFQGAKGGVTLLGTDATKQQQSGKQPGEEIGAMDELLKELVINVKAMHEVCNRTMGMCEKMYGKVCEDDGATGGDGQGAGDGNNPVPPASDDAGKGAKQGDEPGANPPADPAPPAEPNPTELEAIKADATKQRDEIAALAKSVGELAKAVALIAERVDAK